MIMRWWYPTTPYTTLDALQRAASATGSFTAALNTSDAAFNGHRYEAHPQTIGIYKIGYQWAGYNILGRASLEDTLQILADRAKRGRGGSSVITLGPWENMSQAEALCQAALYSWLVTLV